MHSPRVNSGLAPPAEFRLVRHMDSRQKENLTRRKSLGGHGGSSHSYKGMPAREQTKKKKKKKTQVNPFADDVLTNQQALSIAEVPRLLSTHMAPRISTFAEGSLNPGGHARRKPLDRLPRPKPWDSA